MSQTERIPPPMKKCPTPLTSDPQLLAYIQNMIFPYRYCVCVTIKSLEIIFASKLPSSYFTTSALRNDNLNLWPSSLTTIIIAQLLDLFSHVDFQIAQCTIVPIRSARTKSHQFRLIVFTSHVTLSPITAYLDLWTTARNSKKKQELLQSSR